MITLIIIAIIYTCIGWIKFFNLKEKEYIYDNELFFCSFILCNIFIGTIIIGLMIKYLP